MIKKIIGWFDNLKFHIKLGIAINVPIFIFLLLAPIFSTYVFKQSLISETIEIRLKQNYDLLYISLIEGHINMPIINYRFLKHEILEKFKYANIYPSDSVSSMFNLERFEIKDENLKKVFESKNKVIFLDKKNDYLTGYFPIKASASCLTCHSNAKEDDILGVLSITISLKPIFGILGTTQITLIALGILEILLISIILYLAYMKHGHTPIMVIASNLNSLAEGDLSFKIDQSLLNKSDIIGDLARNLKKLKDYLNSFNSRILDFSIKLTKQVDNIFKSVDTGNVIIKRINLNINEVELIVENLYRIVNEISRKTIKINTLLKVLTNLRSDTISNQNIDWGNINETINNLNTETIELIEKIEKVIQDEEKIADSFEEISRLFNDLNKILDQINSYVYENLIISTYMKNLASTVKLEAMEEIVFDLFETDLDRYILRIESHIKGIESLDPTRWSDPKALSIGKWLETEEYLEFRKQIKDFNFTDFEKEYNELFILAKEIIQAYNREDYITVDKNLEKLRRIYLKLKDYLAELRHLYLEFMETKAIKGG